MPHKVDLDDLESELSYPGHLRCVHVDDLRELIRLARQTKPSGSKYDYETFNQLAVTSRPEYRIRDVASDNALARCGDESNAKLIVEALNKLDVDYMTYMRGQVAATK